MTIRGIHHVAMNVHDLDHMLRFYTDGLGFEVVMRTAWADDPKLDRAVGVDGTAGRSAMLRAGNCHVELFEYSAPEPTVTQPLRPNDKGYTHFCIDVTDARETCDHLRRFGMTLHADPVDFGPVATIYGRDPEGNVIEIQEIRETGPLSLEALALPARAGRPGGAD